MTHQGLRWSLPRIDDGYAIRFEIPDIACRHDELVLCGSRLEGGIDGRDLLPVSLHAGDKPTPGHHYGDVERQDTIIEAD
jgi:hypothetical protein